nr:MAG TPA: hypothetical protein [Caudoviricetes sp.]
MVQQCKGSSYSTISKEIIENFLPFRKKIQSILADFRRRKQIPYSPPSDFCR